MSGLAPCRGPVPRRRARGRGAAALAVPPRASASRIATSAPAFERVCRRRASPSAPVRTPSRERERLFEPSRPLVRGAFVGFGSDPGAPGPASRETAAGAWAAAALGLLVLSCAQKTNSPGWVLGWRRLKDARPCRALPAGRRGAGEGSDEYEIRPGAGCHVVGRVHGVGMHGVERRLVNEMRISLRISRAARADGWRIANWPGRLPGRSYTIGVNLRGHLGGNLGGCALPGLPLRFGAARPPERPSRSPLGRQLHVCGARPCLCALRFATAPLGNQTALAPPLFGNQTALAPPPEPRIPGSPPPLPPRWP